ncbi:MAG TPA: SDR family oxidoreductase [Opitutaceae bacterium]|nr:SDR family oxidoreductase [Lacunisphaera sp.]HWA09183.1 SDR family oxidoreductase [Opitutaceae bacterium]
MSRRPTVLVTGATGLLGANFCAVASEAYEIVTGAHRHALTWPGTRPIALELDDAGKTMAALDLVRPEIVIHFAAMTDVDACEKSRDAAARINVSAPHTLANWASRHGARMLLMSTDSVFDGTRSMSVESDLPGPINYYAETKLRSEATVATLEEHLIVRSNIFGWSARGKSGLAEWILEQLRRGEEVPGFANIWFNPLLVNTLSGMMLELLKRDARGIVHLSSREPLSKYDFACRIACEFGYDLARIRRTTREASAPGARRPLDTTLASLRAGPEFGLGPPSIEEEIRKFRQLDDTGFVARLKMAVQ